MIPDDDSMPEWEGAEIVALDVERRRRTLAKLGPDLKTIISGLKCPPPDDDAGWEAWDRAQRERESRDRRCKVEDIIRTRGVMLARDCGFPRQYVDWAIAADQTSALIRRVAAFCDAGNVLELMEPAARRVTMLVLSGGVGCGKTTAATWWAIRAGGERPVFLRAGQMATLGRYDKPLSAKLEACTSLVLDDLGREFNDGKGSFLAHLEDVVEAMYGSGRPMIITTNVLAPEAFHRRYGGPPDCKEPEKGPIPSRLRGAGRWFGTSEPDRRKP